MTNPSMLLRSLVIYAICIPLALIMGYVLAGPFDYTLVGVIGSVTLVLLLPALLRFHHPLMILGWNMSMIVFFLPGAPRVWLPLVAVSLLLSIVKRTIDQNARFISVPALTRPLLAIAFVVLVTAEATGGINLRTLGGGGSGGTFGGKRYIFLLGAVAGYFALTAQRIPRERAGLYVALFFMGGLTNLMGDVFYLDTRALQWLFWFFPPVSGMDYWKTGVLSRLTGVSSACWPIFGYMLAKYGIRGIFVASRPLRLLFFAFLSFALLLGGFRSLLISAFLAFSLQFFMEGLHRTKLLPILLIVVATTAVVSFPFMSRLPFGVQRAFSFLPIDVDPRARMDAEASADWRLQLWKAVLPEVPKYLLLGKGLAISRADLELSTQQTTQGLRAFTEDQQGLALAGDFHSGPLTLIIPFGIWGVAAFLWFVYAAIRVLYRNCRYGVPELRNANTTLFVLFIVELLLFLFIVGGFYSDLMLFVGYVGLSVSLNSGVAEPGSQWALQADAAKAPAAMLPRPRSPFERSGDRV